MYLYLGGIGVITLLYWYGKIISSTVAKVGLRLCGWKPLSAKSETNILRNTRAIYAFPHTSYWDFYIFLCYMLAYPHLIDNVKILVKPGPFVYAGWLLRRLGCLPATSINDKGHGCVSRITEDLKHLDHFKFTISPKGSIERKPWRNGYYYIGVGLEAVFVVAGLDYRRKELVVRDQSISYTEGLDKVESFLKEEMRHIVPLYPEEELAESYILH